MTIPGCFSFLRKRSAKVHDEKYIATDDAGPWIAPASTLKASHAATFEQPPEYASTFSGTSDGYIVISDAVDKLSGQLREVSLQMHDHPEIAWQEVETGKLLSGFMAGMPGWSVKRSDAYGTKTGWEASFTQGTGGRTIGFNSEMDALPGIGHACGHNLIAIAGMGAALATAAAMQADNTPGRVVLLGTPAEEADGGKIVMIKNGGYKQMDVCLMAHPTSFDGLAPMLAVSECEVEYFGRNAHAAGAPWEGVNALDAAVLAYNNVSALRQQTSPDARLHGIIQGSDEWVCNIIPAHSKLQFGVRHPLQSEVVKLKAKVEHCFRAAAEATGCKMEMKWTMQYLDMQNNDTLAGEYQRFMQEEQKTSVPFITTPFASTDFGDVTYELPALHPMFRLPGTGNGTNNHTIGFTKAAATPEAHAATLKVMKGLAATAYKVLTDDSFAQKATKEYREVRKPQKP